MAEKAKELAEAIKTNSRPDTTQEEQKKAKQQKRKPSSSVSLCCATTGLFSSQFIPDVFLGLFFMLIQGENALFKTGVHLFGRGGRNHVKVVDVIEC